jgi:sulfur relay (sulfurtransferase) DsrC/TusE family protein
MQYIYRKMSALSIAEIDCIANNVYTCMESIAANIGVPHATLVKYKNLSNEKEKIKAMLIDWNHDEARKKIIAALCECDDHWTILTYMRNFNPEPVKDIKYSLTDTIELLKKKSVGKPLSKCNNNYWFKFELSLPTLQQFINDSDKNKEVYLHKCASRVAHSHVNQDWYFGKL